ncbi:superoxide dismutase [Clostridium novyi A str. NCTC 538]|uniref:Superoxide dismutase n=2 Tax=Clostridium novyi TaxID=1542 RepID=A0Q246_CLONN|nr:superoxide dismutase (Mn/Fe family) [Clostridium novyi NT]KEH85306.1 superoxide dismutase [Clostridium novyi A str. BKT29909]KEH86216.1 superoxide dismutase [Clostridium novyi A str. NCTC 538]KEH88501.1 superoxide dismutase [Clostridium novyi A str. 4540]KEH93278.1 superoxide dismutase [Clostridium novyi A str. GD211209]
MFKLPNLPYDYNALEPYYDEETVRIHHDKHHQAYVDGLNKAETKLMEARESGDFSTIKHWERELAFNGAGNILHTLFWENMIPGGSEPTGEIINRINKDFGNFDNFKNQFSAAAAAVEGSGWCALVWIPRFEKLEILQIEKHQDLAILGATPLLLLDLWEHAYYLKYQNRRADFIKAWWNIVNWNIVNERYLNSINK